MVPGRGPRLVLVLAEVADAGRGQRQVMDVAERHCCIERKPNISNAFPDAFRVRKCPMSVHFSPEDRVQERWNGLVTPQCNSPVQGHEALGASR